MWTLSYVLLNKCNQYIHYIFSRSTKIWFIVFGISKYFCGIFDQLQILKNTIFCWSIRKSVSKVLWHLITRSTLLHQSWDVLLQCVLNIENVLRNKAAARVHVFICTLIPPIIPRCVVREKERATVLWKLACAVPRSWTRWSRACWRHHCTGPASCSAFPSACLWPVQQAWT